MGNGKLIKLENSPLNVRRPLVLICENMGRRARSRRNEWKWNRVTLCRPPGRLKIILRLLWYSRPYSLLFLLSIVLSDLRHRQLRTDSSQESSLNRFQFPYNIFYSGTFLATLSRDEFILITVSSGSNTFAQIPNQTHIATTVNAYLQVS